MSQSTTPNQDIDRFFGYFSNALSCVQALNSTSGDMNTLKTIQYAQCFSMLDSLAGVALPSAGNKKAFLNILDNHCSWSEAQFVSIRCLHSHLVSTKKIPESEEVEQVFKILKCSKSRQLDNSPDCMRTRFDSQIKRVNAKDVDKFVYSHILYKFRCTVIHEFRPPTISSLSNSPQVYYLNVTDTEWNSVTKMLEEVKDKQKIIFPLELVFQLVKNAISNLKQHCIAQRINPYDSFDFEDDWMKK